MKRATRTRTLFAAGGLLAAFGVASLSSAQNPPGPPSYGYVYGRVLVGGENISPEIQPVVAFVNGKSCGGGSAQTFVAVEGQDVPAEDVGRTVFVIDVLADGTKNYERSGCGHPGDPIALYFPAIGRSATFTPLFQAGPLRADIELDVVFAQRASLPQVASDGAD